MFFSPLPIGPRGVLSCLCRFSVLHYREFRAFRTRPFLAGAILQPAFFFQPEFFFSNQHFVFPTNKKLFFSKWRIRFPFFFPLKALGRFFPASAVFRSCIKGNSGHSGHVRFWQGKFSKRYFFFNQQLFVSNQHFVFPTDQKKWFFERTKFSCSKGHLFFPRA